MPRSHSYVFVQKRKVESPFLCSNRNGYCFLRCCEQCKCTKIDIYMDFCAKVEQGERLMGIYKNGYVRKWSILSQALEVYVMLKQNSYREYVFDILAPRSHVQLPSLQGQGGKVPSGDIRLSNSRQK